MSYLFEFQTLPSESTEETFQLILMASTEKSPRSFSSFLGETHQLTVLIKSMNSFQGKNFDFQGKDWVKKKVEHSVCLFNISVCLHDAFSTVYEHIILDF